VNASEIAAFGGHFRADLIISRYFWSPKRELALLKPRKTILDSPQGVSNPKGSVWQPLSHWFWPVEPVKRE